MRPAAPLAERLVGARDRGAGRRPDRRGRTSRSGGGGEFAVYDAVRDEAVALGLALVRIEHRRHQLEDLFRAGGADERVA